MLTGISLLIIGGWITIQALAGGAAVRLREAVSSPTRKRMSGGGTRTNPPAGSGGSRELVR